MSRAIIAEYDASENALRLVEPLTGLKDHEMVRVSIETEVGAVDPLTRLAALNAPSGDMPQLLAEIEAGRR
jgi:hypothetical protein